MYTFPYESFGVSLKNHTFASAFEQQRMLTPSEIWSCDESDKRKSSLKRFT